MEGLTENFIFSIIYEQKEEVLELSKYCVVGDLKSEITKKLGIPLSRLDVGFSREPDSDGDILYNHFHADFNCLVVYNRDENEDVPVEVSAPDNLSELENEEKNSLSDKIKEMTASSDFIENFSSNYDGDREIPFQSCCFEYAINEACSKGKFFILYLHNNADGFSKIFAENVIRPELKEKLCNKFAILGWDVENETYHSALKNALLKHSKLTFLVDFIENKTCAALFIVPTKESITVLSCLKGNVSQEDFAETLNQAEELLKSQAEELLKSETKTDFGSTQYQQLMLDMLGDRDYDSFDCFEFDHLKNKIGFALFGPPKKEEGYDEKEKKKIESLFTVIVNENNEIAKYNNRVIVSCIYNCTEPLPSEKQKRAKEYPDYNPLTDLTPIAIFVLRKCKNSQNPCRVFIDDSERVYPSWDSYLKNNKLGQCEMILPKNGRYEPDDDGNVKLEKHLSPACGIGRKILTGTDITSTGAGLASGGVFVAAAIPAITVAPAVLAVAAAAGISVGIYSIGRSIYTLVDRGQHKETLSFANSECRGAYLGIVAGSLGFVGAGANMAVSQLATRGFNIGKGASATVNVLGFANIGASGISVANSGYDVFDQWYNENQTPSLLTIVQLSSSILFFGHAVYNFKQCGTIIEEAQSNTLRDYQDTLRSNRHRKTFNKLVKETVRQSNQDVVQGRAEVIKTIRNIGNKDEVFASLTRSNKAMNKNGVRFAARGGGIELNGVGIDISKFASMDRSEVITFLTTLPNTPEPTQHQVNAMASTITSKFTFDVIRDKGELTRLAFGLVKMFSNTEISIMSKIVNCFVMILKQIKSTDPGVLTLLDEIFPDHNKYFRILNMINGYFQEIVNGIENQYQKWLRTKDPSIEEPYFVTLALDVSKRAVEIFNIISRVYFIGVNPTEAATKQILNYFWTWFSKQVADFNERQQRKEKRKKDVKSKNKSKCPDCGGDCYK